MTAKPSKRGRAFVTLDVSETVVAHSAIRWLRMVSRHLPNRTPELVALQDGLEKRLGKKLEELGMDAE